MKNVLFASAFALALAFASAVSAQSIDINLNANGGIAIGEGEMDLDVSAGGTGSTTGVGNIVERESFSDSAVLAKGELGIDSNQVRTNISADMSVYGGAAAQNTIKTNGVSAGMTSSNSVAGVTGSISYGAGGVNVTGSVSVD